MATPKKPVVKKQLIHLTLDTDNVDAQIADVIGQRIEVILKDQLGNIIAGELAKLKLTGKNPVVVAEVIQKQITAATKAEVRAIAAEHRHELYKEFHSSLETAKNNFREEAGTLRKAFTERLKSMANNIRF